MSSTSSWRIWCLKNGPESSIKKKKKKKRHCLRVISSPPSAGTPRSRPLWSRPAASASCGCCAPRRWGPRSRAGARTRRPSAARTRRGGTRSAAASTAPPLSAACDASESYHFLMARWSLTRNGWQPLAVSTLPPSEWWSAKCMAVSEHSKLCL